MAGSVRPPRPLDIPACKRYRTQFPCIAMARQLMPSLVRPVGNLIRSQISRLAMVGARLRTPQYLSRPRSRYSASVSSALPFGAGIAEDRASDCHGDIEPITVHCRVFVDTFDLLVVAMSGLAGSVTQMAGEVLVHFEHSHLVLPKDPPELVVGQDFAAVFRVL